jgi:hypothetical protein
MKEQGIGEWNDGMQLEALDRLHVAMCMISDHISDHHAVIKAGAQVEVEKALDKLMDAYQKVGMLDE